MENLRLSKWAKLNGYTYRGAYNLFINGNLPNAYVLPSGSIMVRVANTPQQKEQITAIYARVSSSKQKGDLHTQEARIADFCRANGWVVNKSYKEIASGLNDNRQLFNKILDDTTITRIVVEHKDRLSRFGFNYIARLLKQRGCEICVINHVETDREDLMQDFVSLVTSMVARLYGLRKSKRKTELLIMELKKQ